MLAMVHDWRSFLDSVIREEPEFHPQILVKSPPDEPLFCMIPLPFIPLPAYGDLHKSQGFAASPSKGSLTLDPVPADW